jgi:hypothetical protein
MSFIDEVENFGKSVEAFMDFAKDLEDKERKLIKDKQGLRETKESIDKRVVEVKTRQSQAEVALDETKKRKEAIVIANEKREEGLKLLEKKQKSVDKAIKKLGDLEEKEALLVEREEKADKLIKELNDKEDLIKKEKVIARDRQLLLDRREKTLEAKQARVQRYLET